MPQGALIVCGINITMATLQSLYNPCVDTGAQVDIIHSDTIGQLQVLVK